MTNKHFKGPVDITGPDFNEIKDATSVDIRSPREPISEYVYEGPADIRGDQFPAFRSRGPVRISENDDCATSLVNCSLMIAWYIFLFSLLAVWWILSSLWKFAGTYKYGQLVYVLSMSLIALFCALSIKSANAPQKPFQVSNGFQQDSPNTFDQDQLNSNSIPSREEVKTNDRVPRPDYADANSLIKSVKVADTQGKPATTLTYTKCYSNLNRGIFQGKPLPQRIGQLVLGPGKKIRFLSHHGDLARVSYEEEEFFVDLKNIRIH